MKTIVCRCYVKQQLQQFSAAFDSKHLLQEEASNTIKPETRETMDTDERKVPLLIPQSGSVTRTESPSKKRSELCAKIGAAVFYGVASFMIMVVNKHVLTVHKFPSFQVS